MKIGDHVYVAHSRIFCGTITEINEEFMVCKTTHGWYRTNDLSGYYVTEDPFVRFVRETLEAHKS